MYKNVKTISNAREKKSKKREKKEKEVFDPKHFANIVWISHDINVPFGTDMPIFGEKIYPCITLKLKNTTKSIHILTGIDHWLDYLLMSNIPEIRLYYHLNDTVKKYESIEVPRKLYKIFSKFSREIIQDIVQNIWSFLKRKMMKPDHTYWIYSYM